MRSIKLAKEVDPVIGFCRLFDVLGHGAVAREIEGNGRFGTPISPQQRPGAIFFVKGSPVVKVGPFDGAWVGYIVLPDSQKPEEWSFFRVEEVVEAIGEAKISGAIPRKPLHEKAIR